MKIRTIALITTFYFAVSDVSAQGLEHGASARQQFEQMRLKDPQLGFIPLNIRQKELAFAATLPKQNSFEPTAILGSPWQSRGPYFIGGRTRSIGIDVSNENRLIAGSVSGGLWLSEDGGKSWRITQGPSDMKSITCLVQDTRVNHRNVWYAGTGEAYGQSASATGAYYLGDGLLISTDSGKSWNPLTATAGGQPTSFSTAWQLVWNLAMNPTAHDSSSIIYAATYNNIFRSTDAGKTWKTMKTGSSYFTDVAVSNSGVVYATMSSDGSAKGIWRSVNGVDFTNISPNLLGAKYNRMVIGIDPNNENRVYFLINTGGWGKTTSNFKGDLETNALLRLDVLKNTQGADSMVWTDLSANLPNGRVFERWNVQGSYDMYVRVTPGHSDWVIIGGTNVFRSKNGFTDTTQTTMLGGYKKYAKFPDIGTWPNHHPDQHGWVNYPSNPLKVISTNDGGIFRCNDISQDSVIWESLNNGYVTTQLYSVALDHGIDLDPKLIAGAQDNNQIMTNSFDAKAIWKSVYFGDGSHCAIENGGKYCYLSKQEGKMIKAVIDKDLNRTSYRRIDPIGGKKYLFINPFVLDPNKSQSTMYLAGGKYLWRNTELDKIVLDNKNDSISLGWVRAKDSVPAPNAVITALHVCTNPPNRVYYGTSIKRMYKIDRADTGNMVATDITSISLMPGGNVSSITSDPRNGDKVMASYSNYGIYSLFYSADAGKTWQKIGGNLEQAANGSGNGPSVRNVAIVPVENGTVYLVATSIGVFATDTLQGLNTVWIQQSPEWIGNAICDWFDVRYSDGTVAMATHGAGTYTSRYLNTADILKSAALKYEKVSVYPNPNSGSFQVTGVNINQIRQMDILDELGRKAIQLPLGLTVELNNSNSHLKNGLYYLRIELSNGTVLVRRVILNR